MTSAELTPRQHAQAERDARRLVTLWTNDTLKTGRAWTPERIRAIANGEAAYSEIPYAKRPAYIAILTMRLADNFDVELPEDTPTGYPEADSPVTDHPVTQCVMTKDGPQALLPTFGPPPHAIDHETQQLTMF
jgi:hypothetical protein